MEMAGELSVERSWEALRSVIDPEIYQNIVDLGLVYGVDIAPERQVTVTMTLTTPHCPMGPQIIQNITTPDPLQTAAEVVRRQRDAEFLAGV